MLPSRAAVVVAGGGPAGFMAAVAAAEAGRGDVLLLEATPEPLHKVRISGGGRCNVTHACWDPAELVGHYPRGARALRGPFSRFACGDAVAWFDAHGLELVEEADGRLFPRSNRSQSVIETLRRAATAAGVRLCTGAALQRAEVRSGGGFSLEVRTGAGVRVRLDCAQLVLATGSHPSGRQLATSLGHTLVPPVPSLFTLALEAPALTKLAGVVMDPVALELLPGTERAAGERFRQRGTVLITHWGLSGPACLRLTAFAARALKEQGYRGLLQVDWSGGRSLVDLELLFGRLRREQARRQLATARPWPELSRRLWWHLLEEQGLDRQLRWADLPARGQQGLITALRASRYTVRGRGPFGEEFVTAGGVCLGEVNLATMESRQQKGLYLVGELLDVDGVTGGFNFQHCWSSGWLAGQGLGAENR
ncbi:NAD(P)/FAD-dependent oxidoreductase [Synechococcus sp. CBW1107]|uniref:NAD(P)/FAD-dependent oxidoreductase n=1 Tax=Synechococcus sp. CBW1107 TaxID=2789857 RepID=UPI002AD46F92|nr:NAD(P)/FAD-dependent oxidoreductase [Synechococcus sp. CBW1107]CAK6686943.1 3-dehydro-bile acid delta(4,6)-reductase [Synechococcus sp. CBW1107]